MNRTRWLATGAAALAVALGGGAALAASGSSNPASDFLGDVAERLGISRDRLENAVEDTTIARIDAAVAAGEITKQQGEELKERVRSGEVPAIPPGFGGPGLGLGPLEPLEQRAFPRSPPGADLIGTAADYLGMDTADVREALRDGKSLADLAKDRRKSVDGLKDAIRDAIRKDADQAVEDGVLTKDEADLFVRKLSAAIDELVERGGSRGLKFGFGGPGIEIGPLGPGEPGFFPGGPPGAGFMETAADYLGMDTADVREALRDGKSLADLAKDRGKSVDGLKDALRDAIRKDADQAVGSGVLTNAQADRLAKKLGNAVDKLVETTLRDGFEFDLQDGDGKFGLHIRIAPEGGMPLPQGPEGSSFGPAMIPSQPI